MSSGDLPVRRIYDPGRRTDVIFRNSWLPNWVARRLGSRWAITTAAGTWAIVDDAELREMQSIAISQALFDKLSSTYAILHEGNTSDYWKAYARWSEPHVRHPVHHIIISTLRCNLACSYCHAAVVPPDAGKDYDLSPLVATAIIEFAMNSRATMQSFEFQGGESLLNGRVLRAMIEEIRACERLTGKQFHLSIQTNATLLDQEWMTFFEKNDVSVGTSLDGDTRVHDKMRRFGNGQGSHAHVKEAVDRYRLPVLPTIAQHNIAEWQTVVDDQLKDGSPVFTFQPVYPINSARENWDEVGVEGDAFLAIYDRVSEYARSLWRPDYYPLERRFRLALQKLCTGRDTDYADFGNPCGMVHSQIVYHTNGDVYTCDEGRDFTEFKLGSVLTDSYDEVVFGAKARMLKSLSMPHEPPCQACSYRPFCSACPVYERAVAGELHSRHAGTWHCKQTLHIYDKIFSWIDKDPTLLERVCRWHGLDVPETYSNPERVV